MPNVKPSRLSIGGPRSRPLRLRLCATGLVAAVIGLAPLATLTGPRQARAEPAAKSDQTKPAKPEKAANQKSGKPEQLKSATAGAAKTAAPAKPQRALLPKPGVASPDEARYIAALDKAIAPVSATPISAEEAALVRDAIKAVGAANLAKGVDIAAKIRDPVALKLFDWYRLRSGYGEPQEYAAFLEQNPAWPDRALLVQRKEEALFTQGGTASTIRAHFKNGVARTGVGWAALASALLAEGNTEEAAKLAARAWRDLGIPASLETGFLERFGKLLTPADHKWRLDKLIIDDLRWSGVRNARAQFAKRLIPLLPDVERKKANARLAVFMRSSGAKARLEALPASDNPDWGLVFHRIQVLRRAGHATEAAKLLLGAPMDEADTVVPDSWWEERRANAYIALKAGKPKLAFDLVREAGPLSVNPLKEQRFMAGWIALRMLEDTKLAEPQFQALKKAADGPLSRAKASYWLGRTAEAEGDGEAASQHYREAASDADTFHGLLALQKLAPGRRPIEIRAPAEPDAALIEKFNALDAVKAAVIARKSSLDAHVLRSFIAHLRTVFDSEAGSALVAHLSEAVGDTQMAVRTGKAAIAGRQNLLYYAYPVHPFPAYSPLRDPPETAFLLGIARQETEFNTLTVSSAGAKGLLQVMTATAKHVCADYKIKCDIPRLLSDPSYNAMLASAYIADRMEEFSGSYVLTLAGYNAGPGRAREWIAEFGDPRDPKVDPIDWIERIPIQETREYVAKVLANIQIYRARLGESETALRLEDDLTRARSLRPASAGDGTTTADSGG